jgi:hypothetical protein
MPDNTASDNVGPYQPTSIADIVRDLAPMGNLSRFAIDDLTPDEDEFFRILEEA